MKKYIDRKVITKYLYNQLTGNFAGFLIGMSATGLVSSFFETRSIRNLWGLSSKKTVVDKETFSNLEWIISILIGFIVFEVMTKVVKEKIEQSLPTLRIKVYRWAVANRIPFKLIFLRNHLARQRVALFSTVQTAVRHTIAKYSKR